MNEQEQALEREEGKAKPMQLHRSRREQRGAARRVARWLPALGLFGAAVAWPALGQDASERPELPDDVVVDVDMHDSQAYGIGIPNLLGSPRHRDAGTGVLRRDFVLMPGYRVVGPAEVRGADRDLSVRPEVWAPLDARGVIKGRVIDTAGQLQVVMRFYEPARGTSHRLERTYSGGARELRGFMHDFVNRVLRLLTGEAGVFGTQLTFARRVAPGRKDVYRVDMDGHGLRLVSNGRGIAMLPAFDDLGRVWFTRLLRTGMFITRGGTGGQRIITGNGLNMAPSICGDRVFFTSSRSGNSEIYSANTDGGDIRQLTRHPAIDVSPSCGPHGKVAFVSARHGSPLIFMMNADGSDQRQVTFRGTHNQTPTLCPDPRKPLLAFTGRSGGLDVFVLNLATGEYTRLTQGQGANKDPAFSPDCRMVAFVSDRRGAPGVYLSSIRGFNQRRVVEGAAETVRWSH